MAIAISHSSHEYWISARDIYNFPAVSTYVAFLNVETTVCCRSSRSRSNI